MVQSLQRRQSPNVELFAKSVKELTSRDKSPHHMKREKAPTRSKTPTRSSSKERLRPKPIKRNSNSLTNMKNCNKEKIIPRDVLIDESRCQCQSLMENLRPFNLKLDPIKKKSNNTKLVDSVLDNDFALLRKLVIVDRVDVNETTSEGTTVLHIASAAGYLECVRLLLECGANVNTKDSQSRTPLEYAVLYGNFDCASELIEFGANTNVIKDGIH